MGVLDITERMKSYYEKPSKSYLTRRMPVVIRVDGKSFHTFTKGFKKPFDEVFRGAMQDTAKYMCGNIEGCVLGYTQSDEISFVLVDYKSLDTDAWFGYNVQKVSSVSASMATMAFNKFFWQRVQDKDNNYCYPETVTDDIQLWLSSLYRAREVGAMFDARCFNVPKEEVTNYIYSRQLDAVRNSINMIGRAKFSSAVIDGMSTSEIREMCLKIGVDCDSYPSEYLRGVCIMKGSTGNWEVQKDIPMFKGSERETIERLVMIEG